MKIMKNLVGIAFVIGLILIIGAIGTDDFYLMELHQAHDLEYGKIIIGCTMCLPMFVRIMGYRHHGC